MRPLWILVLTMLATPVAAAVLENEALRMEFSDSNGAVVGLYDKRTGTEFIAGRDKARLFQLLMPVPGNYSRRVNSGDQEVDTIEARGGRLRIRYSQLAADDERTLFGTGEPAPVPQTQMDIDVEVTFELDGDHLRGRIRIDNHGHEQVTSVIFPFLAGMPLEIDSRPARIVLPSLGQRVFSSTAAAFGGERAHRYPALLASPWINYEVGPAGFGLELDPAFQAQDALFSLSPGRFQGGSAYRGGYTHPLMGWIFHPHIAGQSQWSSPEVRIHVHEADWHAMAAEHRDRARAEAVRNDPWGAEIGFATVRLKRHDNTIDWHYGQLPELARAARRAGMRRLVVHGWREREGPANPAPFGEIADPRLGGAAGLRRVIGELAGEGTELLFSFHPALLNVFYPTTAGGTKPNYPPPQHAWLVKTSRGANQIPVDFGYFTFDYPIEEYANRYRVEIDPASPATDFLLDEAHRLRDEYGMRNLFLEGIGQRAFLTYNDEHPVAPQDAYAEGYARFLGGLRKLFPGGLLLAEGFNDLVNSYSDGGYAWNQLHDAEVLAFSAPARYFSNDVEALDYAGANASFARKMLINLVVDGGRGTVESYPEFAAHLEALRELKLRTAPYYAQAEFRDREGVLSATGDDDVVVSAFLNIATNQRGIVIANPGRDPRTVGLKIDLAESRRTAKLHRLSGAGSDIILANGASITMGPYEVAIIAIDPN